MPDDELIELFAELREDVLRLATAGGEPQNETFFNLFASLAAENGDCVHLNYIPVLREGKDGYRIDGFEIDDIRGELHIAVVERVEDYTELNKAPLQRIFSNVANFLTRVFDESWINEIEESSTTFEAAWTIRQRLSEINRIRILLLTNATLRVRRRVGSTSFLDKEMTYSWIDLSRYRDIMEAQGRVEPVSIDILEMNDGKCLPALNAHASDDDYHSFLIALPAELLASIYSAYGARLLEQNVRTFLQARTKVNQGIINTVEKEPARFFAYNNGLTATASYVEFDEDEFGDTGIVRLEDLQIVNGGQTTASILYAKDRKKASLDRVTVPMKLSVIESDRLAQFVPLVSRYANSQNRISETDFAASDRLHITLEKVSRRLSAPVRSGETLPAKWFYERARGQYRDSLSRVSGPSRRAFESEFPKPNVITKIELAKYHMSFEALPHVVSLGAQKCFVAFTEHVGSVFDDEIDAQIESWYKTAVSKAILFRTTDKGIERSTWYRERRGYKANIVAYTLAVFVSKLPKSESRSLLSDIWAVQSVPEPSFTALMAIAQEVASDLRRTPLGVTNVSEYAKKENCWKVMRQNLVD